jgi:hypothetical protein
MENHSYLHNLHNCASLLSPVERYVPLGTELTQKRDQVFADLHSLLAHRLGSDPAAIGVRYGQLMGFVQEIAVKIDI